MEILYDVTQETFVNPTEEPFKSYVKNTQTSVTETPNFFQKKEGYNNYAIVDMPGHADTSLIREMVNFHYIKTMASNLKRVTFLIVINLDFIGGKFYLPDSELKMLKSFMESFPNCKENFKIIINRLQFNKRN
jgi:GTP-binding protein EngB required for normal cell division